MPTLDYIFFDTQDLGTSVNTDIVFFANNENTDGLAVTNLQTANEIPKGQRFTVDEIHVIMTTDMVFNDVLDILEEAMIEVLINNNRKLIVPAILCGSNVMNHASVEDMTDAAVTAIATPTGGPFKLQVPIVLEGGVPFKINFRTGTTAAGSGSDCILALRGTWEF